MDIADVVVAQEKRRLENAQALRSIADICRALCVKTLRAVDATAEQQPITGAVLLSFVEAADKLEMLAARAEMRGKY